MANKRAVSLIVVLSTILLMFLSIEAASAETLLGADWKEIYREDFEGDTNFKNEYTATGSNAVWNQSQADWQAGFTNYADYDFGDSILILKQRDSIWTKISMKHDSSDVDTPIYGKYSDQELRKVRISFNIAKKYCKDTVTRISVQGDDTEGISREQNYMLTIKNYSMYYKAAGTKIMEWTNNKWYAVDIYVDCDNDTYSVAVDGDTILEDADMDYNFDKIYGLNINADKGGTVSTGNYYTYIDNISFSILESAIGLEPEINMIQFAQEFRIRAAMNNKMTEFPDTSKIIVALYDDNGYLLDCSIKDYADSIETKSFKRSYNGIAPQYLKLFIWDGMDPVIAVKTVELDLNGSEDLLVPVKGENGNWWVDDHDTGISSDNADVLFRIDPMTCFLEVSYDNCKSWIRLDHRADNAAEEYDYPLGKREILNGTIRDYDNIFISSSGYRGSLISVEDSVYDTVTMTKGDNSIGYAFLAAKPEAYKNGSKFPTGYTPSYAAGYTRVVYTDDEEITVKIPYNAKYIYIYNNSEGESYVPSSVKFTKSGDDDTEDDNSIRLATWNIGHYSLGEHSYSDVKSAQFEAKSAEYEDYIYNVLDADVIGLNEYSKEFVTGSKNSKDTIFSKYPVSYEGEQRQYSCNALYAKSGLITNIEAHEIECNIAAGGSGVAKPSNYYYVTADLNVNGKVVKLVSVHLVYTDPTTASTMDKQQIAELIDVFSDYDRVILMGDWNCAFDRFDAFTEAGYSLANTDYKLSTYSECQGSRYYSSYVDYKEGAYDNIIYKGVTVSGFGLGGTKLSDHYGVYCTIKVD